ncbi:hypothetical protein GALL_394120 [mine drainage metagenome]|uniref:SOS response-associated peptidase YedK n=1 Tax=mine drainage metagenome TaxID=410659 RepID=A0A1J5Q594_9ZZZZ
MKVRAAVGETLAAIRHAVHGTNSLIGDAVAVYFRSADVALAFTEAFPLALANDTMVRTDYSPEVPFGRQEKEDVCNLYSMTTAQEAMRRLFPGLSDHAGNLPPLPEIYPDRTAPIIRTGAAGRELVMARWGLPTPPAYLVGKRSDRGVTNVRNTASAHWRRWLRPEFRCLVPFTRFAEPDHQRGGNVWFALPEEVPGFFAGIQVPQWRSVRKIKDGETVDDLFGFLTCPPNAEVAAIHPKAMPVILTKPAEWEIWLTAPATEATALQRPLDDGRLIIDSAAR